jgi:hypothetical protein
MWPVRLAGLIAVLGSLAACADDTDRSEPTSQNTSQSTSDLRDSDGLGDDVPMPLPPGPWNDPNWTPPRASFDDRDHDPVGPAHACALDYLKIYDPGRSRTIEVPVVRCD